MLWGILRQRVYQQRVHDVDQLENGDSFVVFTVQFESMFEAFFHKACQLRFGENCYTKSSSNFILFVTVKNFVHCLRFDQVITEFPSPVFFPRVSEWVEFNAPLDTIQVISEAENFPRGGVQKFTPAAEGFNIRISPFCLHVPFSLTCKMESWNSLK